MREIDTLTNMVQNPVDSSSFRTVMGRFATGVTIVTVSNNGKPHGMTVNAFSSVSLDPTLILICLERQTLTAAVIRQTGTFAINILTSRQKRLAEIFSEANNEASRFDNVSYGLSAQGLPVLKDTLGYLECVLRDEYDGGDHFIFIGEVVGLSLEKDSNAPLLYYKSDYTTLNP
jgi:3-hydroxy-9,10-secoandrosta-1,3,5(10)-triene-9,17-dione monooxygenase reductase component